MADILYVCGFAVFGGSRLLLIRKARPAWQKRFLNGVGGHIEEGETIHEAMVREFREETGIITEEVDWVRKLEYTHYNPPHVMPNSSAKVYYLVAELIEERNEEARDGSPGETLWWQDLYRAGSTRLPYSISPMEGIPMLPNLHWIIPLCLDTTIHGLVEIDATGDIMK